MEQFTNYSLKHLNTFKIDARAKCYIRFDRMDEIPSFLATKGLSKRSHLILGGGSNLLFVGDVVDTILHPVQKGIQVLDRNADYILVRVMAGECWDDWVAYAVSNGWGGIENLSLIPGSVGASAIQNIGAYGVEVESVIEQVEALTIPEGSPIIFAAKDCGFRYRNSHFKSRWPGRHLITAIVFRLQLRPRLEINYPGVREQLKSIGPPSLINVRRAVANLRRKKLPDPDIQGNAGSFFKNPVVSADVLRALLRKHPHLPHYSQGNNQFKLAAGWLIDQCGWRGKAMAGAAVHDRQALVLINRGCASGEEILNLSKTVARSVETRFGIILEREVQVVGGRLTPCGCK